MGERQLVAIATTVAAHTPAMIFDEPFTGLDVEMRNHVRRLLLCATTQGVIVLISSHRAENLDGLVEDVTIVSHSHVTPTVDIDDLRSRYLTLSGTEPQVTELISDHPVLADAHLSGLRRATIAVDTPLTAPADVQVHPVDSVQAIYAAITHAIR